MIEQQLHIYIDRENSTGTENVLSSSQCPCSCEFPSNLALFRLVLLVTARCTDRVGPPWLPPLHVAFRCSILAPESCLVLSVYEKRVTYNKQKQKSRMTILRTVVCMCNKKCAKAFDLLDTCTQTQTSLKYVYIVVFLLLELLLYHDSFFPPRGM